MAQSARWRRRRATPALKMATARVKTLVRFCLLACFLPQANADASSRSIHDQTSAGESSSAPSQQVSRDSNNKIKSTIGEFLQLYAGSAGSIGPASRQPFARIVGANLQAKMRPSSLLGSEYRCAKYCTCSIILVTDRSDAENRANLTRATCEDGRFSDVLSIDRRTQIIHISLPQTSIESSRKNSSSQEATGGQVNELAKAQSSQFPLAEQPFKAFRMPRLVEFNSIREISFVNLRFEVCDSEVFKRGQKLRRFRLNFNQLNRISKACFKHLDKLIELNLDFNKLNELESALFNSLLNLRSLSIAYNQLSELAAHQFANLTKLISLNLVGNSFKTINLHLFEPMQNSLRLLVLAKNQIKSFQHSPVQVSSGEVGIIMASNLLVNKSNENLAVGKGFTGSSFVGVVFRNLIKLNVDQNKLERVKLLQLHRFYNVKFLSIRGNKISSIRDKAFNGLKLIELNLAYNQLQSISKCAFCNSTIKRLVLANNNISIPLPGLLLDALARPPLASHLFSGGGEGGAGDQPARLPDPLAQTAQAAQQQPQHQSQPASSSQNMLILSQSIFGPLFGQLEYLDLSYNELLSEQLDLLLEPLLKLEFLNLASVGLDRTLPSPSLFKNLRHLRYLNLSRNQLDQMIAETIEPLGMLEILDLSQNKFSELDESFLVATDELPSLRVLNLGSNPWFCSQCKIAPLYDWILRSPIYNATCIVPSMTESRNKDDSEVDGPEDEQDQTGGQYDQDGDRFNLGASNQRRLMDESEHDYSLLIGNEPGDKIEEAIDFDLILGSSQDQDQTSNYNLFTTNDQQLQLSAILGPRELATSEDDLSIVETISTVVTQAQGGTTDLQTQQFKARDYCLKCEFPGELSAFNIHELNSGDFKFCAGAAPRFAASEPKIGLTLAIVIIGALFCIIIVVIVMYRKKSNTYYTNEDLDQLAGGTSSKRPVFSVSSDTEHQYGDATDYSSPPMSQSYESCSQDDEDEELEEEEEEEEEDEEYEDEEEELDSEEEELDEELSAGRSDRGAEVAGKGEERRSGGESNSLANLDNGRRLAAAEQERRNQLAEYHRNESKLNSQSGHSNQTSPFGASQVASSSSLAQASSSGSNMRRPKAPKRGDQQSSMRASAAVGQPPVATNQHRAGWATTSTNTSSPTSMEPESGPAEGAPPAADKQAPLPATMGLRSLQNQPAHVEMQRSQSRDSQATKSGRAGQKYGLGGSLPKAGGNLVGAVQKISSASRAFGQTSGESAEVGRRRPMRSSQTLLEQTAIDPKLQGPSSEVVGSHQGAAPKLRQLNASELLPEQRVPSPAGRRTPLGARHANFGQLGRQRFAFRCDTSGQFERPKAATKLVVGAPVELSAEELDAEVEAAAAAFVHETGLADLQQMEPLKGIRSPSASDATTADSLAMEALESYLAADEEPGAGGALESAADLEPEEEEEAAAAAGKEAEGLDLELTARSLRGGGLLRARGPASNHSALTQTESRDGSAAWAPPN